MLHFASLGAEIKQAPTLLCHSSAFQVSKMLYEHVILCFHGWRSWKHQPHLYSKAINSSSADPSSKHIGSSHADCFIDIDQGKVSKHSAVSLTGAGCCLCMPGERSLKKLKPLFRSITTTPTCTFIIFWIFISFGHFCETDRVSFVSVCLKKKNILATNSRIVLLIDPFKLAFTGSFGACPCYFRLTGGWKPHLQCKCYRSNDTLNSLYQYIVIQGLWALIKCH